MLFIKYSFPAESSVLISPERRGVLFARKLILSRFQFHESDFCLTHFIEDKTQQIDTFHAEKQQWETMEASFWREEASISSPVR